MLRCAGKKDDIRVSVQIANFDCSPLNAMPLAHSLNSKRQWLFNHGVWCFDLDSAISN